MEIKDEVEGNGSEGAGDDKMTLEMKMKLVNAQSEFKRIVAKNVKELVDQGKDKSLASLHVLLCINPNFVVNLPSQYTISRAVKRYGFLNDEQAVHALVLQHEMKKMKTSGVSSAENMESVIDRLNKNLLTREFDEEPLQVLWNDLFSDEAQTKFEEERENAIFAKLLNCKLNDMEFDVDSESENSVSKNRSRNRTKGKGRRAKSRKGLNEMPLAEVCNVGPVQFDEIFNRKQILALAGFKKRLKKDDAAPEKERPQEQSPRRSTRTKKRNTSSSPSTSTSEPKRRKRS